MIAPLPRFRFLRTAALVALLALTGASSVAERGGPASDRPNVLLISVDTLRVDRVSAYGYERETTPHVDTLIRSGVRFDQARTVEPLTSPALCSMITSLDPHEHGSSRNGLRMRQGLASLPKALQAHGYRTAAFVGNWTLRDKLSGLAEHFERYEEVMTRKRWFGLLRGEADADDITDGAEAWLDEQRRRAPDVPFLLWVHYVEPHAPYRLHRDEAARLGLDLSGDVPAGDRYDTEIAFVDAAIGRLLRTFARLGLTEETIVVFVSDHGESLGEHGYWGHGRNLYEPTLRIPMSITWKGRLRPTTIAEPSLIVDLAPTVLGLAGEHSPGGFGGYDWTPVIAGGTAPRDRITRYQTHRGAVISRHDSDLARRAGLLEVGMIHDRRKEIFRVENNRTEVYDLAADPGELHDVADRKQAPTEGLQDWMRTVYNGLSSFEDSPPEPLDEESIDKLRSLGYVD